MSVTEMWQKQLSENLFCTKCCYADAILEITVSQCNLKSNSFLATFFGGFIGRKSTASLFLPHTEYSLGKLFPEHFPNMHDWARKNRFEILAFRYSKMELP